MITVTAIDMTAAGDRDELAAMLSTAGLAITDLEEPDRVFLRFDRDGPIGFAGIEGVGTERLLRSVVVAPAKRGGGVGRDIVTATEREAAGLGAQRLHLLTEGAAPFFASLDYAMAERAGAPVSIMVTAQFSSLCPASATYMVKTIGNGA